MSWENALLMKLSNDVEKYEIEVTKMGQNYSFFLAVLAHYWRFITPYLIVLSSPHLFQHLNTPYNVISFEAHVSENAVAFSI